MPAAAKKWIPQLILISVIAISLFIRVYDLPRRPVHHDEGINGWFIEGLLERHDYKYSPQHYHGPTFFYIGGFSAKTLGLNIFSLRLVTGIFGFLLCLLPLFLRREMGLGFVLPTMIVLGFSPALVFYSRYAIHEIMYLFFSALFAVYAYLYRVEKKLTTLVIAALALAFAAATKETVVIMLFAVMFGIFLTLLDRDFLRSVRTAKYWKHYPYWHLAVALIALVLGLRCWFHHQEMLDFLNSYRFYFSLGTEKSGHKKPWIYFWNVLFRAETMAVLGAFAGAVVAVWKRRPFYLFCLGWTAILAVAHTVLAYKTPWLIMNMILPMAFLTGCFCHWFWEKFRKRPDGRMGAVALAAFTIATLRLAVIFSFFDYSEPYNPYCYVHTYPEAQILADRVKKILDRNQDLSVGFMSPENWPFPFLLHGYKKVFWWGKFPEDMIVVKYPIIIIRDDQHDELMRKVNQSYHQENYRMRPGVNLQLFIEESLYKENP